ncbi:hypothetical protein FHS09_004372 [Microbulbifer rhizosphaerae]|uniref:Uncharacterized protein n=1 Tax=Microbulbifer rhizosphaerae TaxID=1562603 RepID=A0A7W4WFY6_9GAMM|nr:hypothetical protein [Microbulbifer rhizosphaerae]
MNGFADVPGTGNSSSASGPEARLDKGPVFAGIPIAASGGWPPRHSYKTSRIN